MSKIPRVYEKVISNHFGKARQMVFLPGPRQVGKTTIARSFEKVFIDAFYRSWDIPDHQSLFLSTFRSLEKELKVDVEKSEKTLLIFDEIHKFPNWKNWLKGFFDTFEKNASIIVTGSAMLNVYQQGGDSMMGRYFPYHIHPLSVAELINTREWGALISPPAKIEPDLFEGLLKFGGFPEPFLSASENMHYKWSDTKEHQLFREDMRDLTNIRELSQVKMLAQILKAQTGKNTSHLKISKKIQATAPSIKKWIEMLRYLFFCFEVKPWSRNITRSLIKEPKYYLWDWSQVFDEGARNENFVASHLYKAVQFWTHIGLGKHKLYYLRDRRKREVDFLVTKKDEPWFLVEVKSSSKNGLTPALHYFFEKTKAKHAFQVVFDEPYVDIDCFSYDKPIIISVQTLLSQLV